MKNIYNDNNMLNGTWGGKYLYQTAWLELVVGEAALYSLNEGFAWVLEPVIAVASFFWFSKKRFARVLEMAIEEATTIRFLQKLLLKGIEDGG